jgi:hypothetical protein
LVLDVRLPGLSGLDFQGVQLLGDEPALSESEVLYQRMLANDTVAGFPGGAEIKLAMQRGRRGWSWSSVKGH